MSKGIHVTSEIGQLRKVCLHRPGNELLNLPPFELERLLFDDVPFLKVAQEEHDAFAQILRDNGTEVLYLENLTAEAFDAHPEARQEFLDTYLEESGVRNLSIKQAVREYLQSFKDNKEFVLHTMAGVTKTEMDLPTGGKTLAQIVGEEEESDLIVDPMPNLYFTRDPFACVGNGVNINRMYSVTRNRETLYGKMIFEYHPDYDMVPTWFERDVRGSWTEGGDVLNLNNKNLAVGISQRTTAEAIDIMAQNMFWREGSEECEIENIYAFNIPNNRAMMHLDTVFTQIDVDKFTIHPAIMGTLQVFKLTKGSKPGEVKIEEMNDKLENVLAKALGLDHVEILPCGAGDPIAAAREQWNDGSNTLAVAPGKIVVYQRNDVTNDFLYKHGLDLQIMPSAELSRGRGGPRCMSMPFERDDVKW